MFAGRLTAFCRLAENVTRVACGRVDVLSFLVSELGDDSGGTWPWNAGVTAPETEVSGGSVHIASLATQTFAVTDE